jgi:hypothetical protein
MCATGVYATNCRAVPGEACEPHTQPGPAGDDRGGAGSARGARGQVVPGASCAVCAISLIAQKLHNGAAAVEAPEYLGPEVRCTQQQPNPSRGAGSAS